MPDRQLLYYSPVEQINRFDVLISDPHKHGDPYTTIEGSVKLTLQEVWDWLCDCGEWSFMITAHGDSNNVFMRGETNYKSMKSASEGRTLVSLCTVTKEESEELAEKVHARVLKEMNDRTQNPQGHRREVP